MKIWGHIEGDHIESATDSGYLRTVPARCLL